MLRRKEKERTWRLRRELELEIYEGGIEGAARVQISIDTGTLVYAYCDGARSYDRFLLLVVEDRQGRGKRR